MILVCKQTMANHIPKKQHEFLINTSMEVAKEHFKQKNYARAIEALRIPLKRIPKQVTKDVINMMLELLLINERYSECLDIFTQFCGFSFDVSVTEEQSIIVNSYIIPEKLQVDLKMKFIICLVRLRSCNLITNLIDGVLLEDDVEVVGDLYLDVVEALMQMCYPQEAIKLLVPLVKSKNYSLAGVWLKYAECLATCQMPDQAVEAYFTVMALAPSHVEVLYPLAMLLLQQNKKKEALEVLSQDLSSNKLDVAVLIEQMKLLKQINDWDNYWKSVELLLSRHCVVLKNPEELKIVLTQATIREKMVKLRKMRNFRSEHTEIEASFVSIREPTIEEEYRIYKEILQLAKDRGEYSFLQKFAFMGLCSKRFPKYFDEIFLIAFYSCVFNKDYYHGYTIIRDLIIKYPENNLCWNWFTLITQASDDIRHSRFLERYQDKLPAEHRGLIVANYDLSVGNYVFCLNYFMKEFKKTKSAFSAFMLGVVMLQLYSQRFMNRTKKKVMAETTTYLFLNYSKIRGLHAPQEAYYNLGRMYHQLGIMYLAEYYYKKVFKVNNDFLEDYPEVLCLKREAAYNLHHIYRNNGNLVAARNVLMEHIVV
ncbi:hypothetical protein NQ314_018593 [Rhamnusium bicolor]|uniref:General transcription factor 3C polypeptide 3 n=1 Tax=Rhamnusium bicolor TaxID=1586634 RepID=A0AAV8WPX2_9CUCU|nr:hypothetical protein NQ314_018593 [Rhamnusium bicolor]